MLRITAMDNAISPEAAKTKGIASPVAGAADDWVAPDLEAGDLVARQLNRQRSER